MKKSAIPKIKKAIIPCAGFGTRMAPITKYLPKEMLPLNAKPAIWHILKECEKIGITQICFIVSKKKETFNNYVKQEFCNKFKITLVYQKEMNGLGKAILLGEKFAANNPVYFINPDNFFSNEKAYCDFIKSFNGFTTITCFNGTEDGLKKYAVIEGIKTSERISRITRILEKPHANETKSRLFGYWRAIITPDVFKKLKLIKAGKNNEYQLTDAFSLLVLEKKLFCFQLDSNTISFDIGNPQGFAETNDFFTKNNL